MSDVTSLAHLVELALQKSHERVQPLLLANGQRFWLKRIERLSGRMRLQKGDPAHAFQRERDGLRYLAGKGVSVPEIALAGEDYFVLADAGPTLVDLAHADGAGQGQALTAFEAAGLALAELHLAQLVHGRPAVRDICYDGTLARFIDLERFEPKRRSLFWQAMDVMIFTHSADVQWGNDPRFVEAALASYRAKAPKEVILRVGRLARSMGWLGALARLLLRKKPDSRDIRAYDLTLRRLRQWQ